MRFRYHLKLYVLTTASNIRTHVRGKLVANPPLVELLEKNAPYLLRLLDSDRLMMYAGKHPTRVSLEEAASRLIYDVGPILAVVREAGDRSVRCELYFSDPTITNAFKKGHINKWKQTRFTKRSGAQPLENGDYWAILHRLVSELKIVVCYNPFDDSMMRLLYGDLKDEYRRTVKQLKKNLEGT